MLEQLAVASSKKKPAVIGAGPGPSQLKFGDGARGFFGEFPSNEFISGSALASLVGLTSGTLRNDASSWLKFILDGEIIYVPKLPIRYALTWNQLNAVNLINGSKEISVQGFNLSIGLLKGADADPGVNGSGNYVDGSHHSEWSRLLYPLIKNDADLPAGIVNPLAPYANADLGLTSSDAGRSWCQEVHGFGPTHRVLRGGSSVTGFWNSSATSNSLAFGWRPRLGLII